MMKSENLSSNVRLCFFPAQMRRFLPVFAYLVPPLPYTPRPFPCSCPTTLMCQSSVGRSSCAVHCACVQNPHEHVLAQAKCCSTGTASYTSATGEALARTGSTKGGQTAKIRTTTHLSPCQEVIAVIR